MIKSSSSSHGRSRMTQLTKALSAIHADKARLPSTKVLRVPDPPQLDVQFTGEQVAQGLAQRRALGIPGVVSPQPLPQGLLAGRTPVPGWLTRADSRMQQGQLPIPVAAARIDQRRQAMEPSVVYAARPWHRRRQG